MHVKANGVRCKSPAMRELPFCFFHEKFYNPPYDDSFPPLEDANSVQCAILQVLNGLKTKVITPVEARVMLYVTRNFVVDRTSGALELMRQDGVTGLKAWSLLLTYLWVRPGMFRKIAGAWFKFFLQGFHPWNEDDRHLLAAYEQIASGTEPKRKVRRAA